MITGLGSSYVVPIVVDFDTGDEELQSSLDKLKEVVVQGSEIVFEAMVMVRSRAPEKFDV